MNAFSVVYLRAYNILYISNILRCDSVDSSQEKLLYYYTREQLAYLKKKKFHTSKKSTLLQVTKYRQIKCIPIHIYIYYLFHDHPDQWLEKGRYVFLPLDNIKSHLITYCKCFFRSFNSSNTYNFNDLVISLICLHIYQFLCDL